MPTLLTSSRALAAMLLPLVVAGCASTGSPIVANDDACAASHTAFSTVASAGSTAPVERLEAGYSALQACRLAQADAIRAAAVSGTLARDVAARRLAADQAAFTAETATARQLEQAIAQREGGVGNPVELPRVQGFRVLASVMIFTRPDSASPTIAALRKGQWVSGPTDDAPTGWTALALNDGTRGYVAADALKPTRPNPSSVASSRSRRPGSPLAALAAELEAADREDRVAFGPDAPHGAIPVQ